MITLSGFHCTTNINKYQQGKIYKIVDNAYTKTYYGSTTSTLSTRMGQHRSCYKRWGEGKKGYGYVSSYEIFDEFGIENCKIELVELCPCNSKEELERREGEIIKANECVNKLIPRDIEKPEKDKARRELNLETSEKVVLNI